MPRAFAQNTASVEQLPVNIIAATGDTSKPMVLYITGDGGWNKFSKNLSQAFANKGYPVVALNARDYFWKKKTAAQTTSDITNLIRTYQIKWKCKKIIFVAYSFGADVLPFVFNLLPADVSKQVININLLSPSAFTDFEIHLSVMLGAGYSEGESVVAAINKVASKPITIIFGSGEKDFPVNQLKNKNYTTVILEGGHHYDGDEIKLCNEIIKHIPKN